LWFAIRSLELADPKVAAFAIDSDPSPAKVLCRCVKIENRTPKPEIFSH